MAPLGGNLIEILGFSTATPHETWDGLGVGADKLTREVFRGSIFMQI